MMLPKVCAQVSSQTIVSAEKSAEMRTKLIDYSKEFLGCPYKSGSTGPATFDCSGYVFSMYRESIGIQLPRKSSAIHNRATKIEENEREAGDLVFFKTTSSGAVSHVGIYLGNNEFIHCASDGPETGIIISKLDSGYWNKHYFSSGRIIPSAEPKEEKNTENAK